MDKIATYYKGSDILVSFRLGSEASPIPPSSLIDYEFKVFGEDTESRFEGLTFKKIPGAGELPVIIVNDSKGLVNIKIPASFTADARTGEYYLLPKLILNTASNPNFGGVEFIDKGDPVFAFKLAGL